MGLIKTEAHFKPWLKSIEIAWGPQWNKSGRLFKMVAYSC